MENAGSYYASSLAVVLDKSINRIRNCQCDEIKYLIIVKDNFIRKPPKLIVGLVL